MPEPSAYEGHENSAIGSDLRCARDIHVHAFAEDARRFIERIAENRLRAFTATIDPETGDYLDDPYAQNKSLSEHVAADYHGRCLIELIQNGNDAHPRDRSDGEIEVLLADEGPFGVQST